MSAPQQYPRRLPATINDAGEDCVVLPHDSSQVVVLNNAGRHLLNQCDGTRAVGELVEDTVRTTGANHETVRADLLGFLDQLHHSGVITM